MCKCERDFRKCRRQTRKLVAEGRRGGVAGCQGRGGLIHSRCEPVRFLRPSRHHTMKLYFVFAAACIIMIGCSSLHSTSGHNWVGRWADNTGYFVEVRYSESNYRLKRSGSPTPLTFLDLSKDERRFRYREGDEYIHTLTALSDDVVQDEWLELPASTVWSVMKLHRTFPQWSETHRSHPRP